LHGRNIIIFRGGSEKVVTVLSRDDCRISGSGSMMKRMSFSETVFLFFLALIIFGPKKLPEIARQVGKYMNEFKRASNEFKAQIEQEIAHLEVEKPSILPPSTPPAGATSRTLSSSSSAAPTSSSATASTTEAPAPTEAATLAASEDEPLFATASANAADSTPATEAAAHPNDVTPSSSQESHV
jgi:sec-independent protein translocase protein TatB